MNMARRTTHVVETHRRARRGRGTVWSAIVDAGGHSVAGRRCYLLAITTSRPRSLGLPGEPVTQRACPHHGCGMPCDGRGYGGLTVGLVKSLSWPVWPRLGIRARPRELDPSRPLDHLRARLQRPLPPPATPAAAAGCETTYEMRNVAAAARQPRAGWRAGERIDVIACRSVPPCWRWATATTCSRSVPAPWWGGDVAAPSAECGWWSAWRARGEPRGWQPIRSGDCRPLIASRNRFRLRSAVSCWSLIERSSSASICTTRPRRARHRRASRRLNGSSRRATLSPTSSM